MREDGENFGKGEIFLSCMTYPAKLKL